MKFKTGDKVKMTAETLRCNPRTQSITGVVLGYMQKYPDHIKMKRDGLLSVETWSESAWELQHPKDGPFESAGAPC